ncbi:MAG TPA: hypothetical protein VGD48_07710 [Kutzneria sp.]
MHGIDDQGHVLADIALAAARDELSVVVIGPDDHTAAGSEYGAGSCYVSGSGGLGAK